MLRYGCTWETTSATNWTEATVAQLSRQFELAIGWRPTVKPWLAGNRDLCEIAVVYHRSEVPVRSSDDPPVDFSRSRGTDTLNFLVLHAEQLRLRCRRQFPDLIQKHRAAIGVFE